MAKKKSFAISSNLTQALTETATAASTYSGQLHIEIIPLHKIELDPENPRDLLLNFNDLAHGFSKTDPEYERKKNEQESLQSLVHSIKEQGIINPVVVYKNGDKYRLVAGERRTLASTLAGKKDIQAKILDKKPDELKLSLLQWVENIEREDLSLWERIRNLEKILIGYSHNQQTTLTAITATHLSSLISCSIQLAANYKSVIEASEKLRDAIEANLIKNLDKASFIAKAPLEAQDLLIEECIKGKSLTALKSILAQKELLKKLTKPKESRGRQSSRVNFGMTKNIKVAKLIIKALLESSHLPHLKTNLKEIDWEDYGQVNESFKIILKLLEKTEFKD